MRILIISQFAGSRMHGMILRNYAMAREWVRQGHEVTILASSYFHGRIRQPAATGRVTEEWIDGIRYVWLRGPAYSQAGTVSRVIAMAVFEVQCRLYRFGREQPYDIVVCSSPPPLSIYLARRLAQRWGARLIFDIRDLWPLTLVELGGLSRRHPFIRLLQHAEDYACRHADLVTSVPGNAAGYLAEHGLPQERFLAVPNGLISDPAQPAPLPPEHRELIARLRRDGRFLIGYAGALGVANAMTTAIEALALVDPNVHLLVLGKGAMKDELSLLAQSREIGDRVHFLPTVEPDQVGEFLEKIDVAYIGLINQSIFTLGASPTKLNNYMLAANPVIYAIGDPGNQVEQSGCGIVCEPENPKELAGAIAKIAALSPDERLEMGARGRRWLLENNLVSRHASMILDRLSALPARSGTRHRQGVSL